MGTVISPGDLLQAGPVHNPADRDRLSSGNHVFDERFFSLPHRDVRRFCGLGTVARKAQVIVGSFPVTVTRFGWCESGLPCPSRLAGEAVR